MRGTDTHRPPPYIHCTTPYTIRTALPKDVDPGLGLKFDVGGGGVVEHFFAGVVEGVGERFQEHHGAEDHLFIMIKGMVGWLVGQCVRTGVGLVMIVGGGW